MQATIYIIRLLLIKGNINVFIVLVMPVVAILFLCAYGRGQVCRQFNGNERWIFHCIHIFLLAEKSLFHYLGQHLLQKEKLIFSHL